MIKSNLGRKSAFIGASSDLFFEYSCYYLNFILWRLFDDRQDLFYDFGETLFHLKIAN